jgi:cyanate lyase
MRVVTKAEAGEMVRLACFRTGVTWTDLAGEIGKDVLWATAALLGQHSLNRADAEIIGSALGLEESVVEVLQLPPYRGSGVQGIPTDPTLYRFYEALDVYGPALKELINERFGDGIMSAINFRIDLQRRSDPGGDRVVVTLDGKFLDYQWL